MGSWCDPEPNVDRVANHALGGGGPLRREANGTLEEWPRDPRNDDGPAGDVRAVTV
jgi:hypothetical protein